jgi:hypothetical protein
MLSRLKALAKVLRPRGLAQTAKEVDDLLVTTRDLKTSVKRLQESERKVDDRALALEREVVELRETVANLALRESQLRVIYQRDMELQADLERLPAILDRDFVEPHVRQAIASAPVHSEPFPHIVIENLLPEPLHDAVIKGIPPLELFADGPPNKQRVVVPLRFAPLFSRQVWTFLVDVVVDRIMAPQLVEKFGEPLRDWLRSSWPTLDADGQLAFKSSDGRILLRRRGYLIPPHRDPKWGFLACLVYLVRPGDSETWGTQLFEVESDEEARGAAPHWIRAEQCRQVKSVPFRRNSALVFLNSKGAHGAQIPADAQPADLERYLYQFRIGPTQDCASKLMALLPDERKDYWTGKFVDYS